MTTNQSLKFVTTEQAVNEEQMRGVTSLWRDVYGGEFGWLDRKANPLTDGYHDRSDYFLSMLNGREPVGTMRIVAAQNLGFHITDATDVAGVSGVGPRIIEVQRLMVKSEFRDKRLTGAPFGIYGCMVRACLRHAILNDVDIILVDCHRDIDVGPLKSLKAMGFQETGDTYVDDMNGLTCVILTMDTKSWIRNILANPSPFNSYLIDPSTSETIEQETCSPLQNRLNGTSAIAEKLT